MSPFGTNRGGGFLGRRGPVWTFIAGWFVPVVMTLAYITLALTSETDATGWAWMSIGLAFVLTLWWLFRTLTKSAAMARAMAVGEDTIDVDHPGRRRAGLITAGAGVGLMIASGVVDLLARRDYNSCVADGFQDPDPACAKTIKDAQHHALYYGTSLFAAGALAVVAGGYLYFTSHQHERVNQTVFVPTVSPDGVGFAALGHF